MIPSLRLPSGRRPVAIFGAVVLVAALFTAVWLITASRQSFTAAPRAPLLSDTVAGAESGPGFALHDEPTPVPGVRFQTADGAPLSLADFRGKLVLLNVWATWCAPCRKEMPTLDSLQTRLGSETFEVVALSIDRGGLGPVQKFYSEIGIGNLKIYLDPSDGVTRTLGLFGLPTTLLIDPQGQEIGRLVGPAEWDSPETIELIRQHTPPIAGIAGAS